MPRKSTIKTKSAAWRSHFDQLLRADRYTLDEMLAKMREKFPEETPPSRSAAGRYSKQVAELGGRMRDIQAAGTALVSELGEDPNDRAGQLLVQAVTTLATHAALQATDADADALSIKEIGMLARGARNVLEARKMSLAERQEIARIAREQLQTEQAEALKGVVKAGGMTAATAEAIRKQVLGIA